MNPPYTRSRLAQVDRKIQQMEDELRDLKKERIRIKEESAKARKTT